MIKSKESPCYCMRHRRCRFHPWVGKIPWRKKWPPTPVFLPGEPHGQGSLGGYGLQGRKESDTTEMTSQTQTQRLNGGYQGLGGRGNRELLPKGTNFQPQGE